LYILVIARSWFVIIGQFAGHYRI